MQSNGHVTWKAPSKLIGDAALTEAIAREARERRAEGRRIRPPRPLGHAIGLMRTRKGIDATTEKGVNKFFASAGAHAGHTVRTQPEDPGAFVDQAHGTAQQRAASFARRAVNDAAPDGEHHEIAIATFARAKAHIEDVDAERGSLQPEIRDLEAMELELEDQKPEPPAPTPPSEAEVEARVAERISGFSAGRAALLTIAFVSGVAEAAFVGGYVADVASLGVAGLPESVNAILPWIVGAVIGAGIPIAAEHAGRAAAGTDFESPWYVRHAVPLVLAAPATLGTGRAVVMAAEEWTAGLLGVGVAVLLTALAAVGAALGHREQIGRGEDDERRARREVRSEIEAALVPPPSVAERKQGVVRDHLGRRRKRDAFLLGRRDHLLTVIDVADDERAASDVRLRAAEAASKQDASQEAGLRDAVVSLYVGRRDAVSARYTGERPPSFYGDRTVLFDRKELPSMSRSELLPEPAELGAEG